LAQTRRKPTPSPCESVQYIPPFTALSMPARLLIVVLLSWNCGSDGRRVSVERQGQNSVLGDQENMAEMKSQSGQGLAAYASLIPGLYLTPAHVNGPYLGPAHPSHLVAPAYHRPVPGYPSHLLAEAQAPDVRNAFPPPYLQDPDKYNTDYYFGAPKNRPRTAQVEEVIIQRKLEKGPYAEYQEQDIYDLASEEVLFVMKDNGDGLLLEEQFGALQAIEKAGINVVPYRLVNVRTGDPVNGDIVPALIEKKVSGAFVDIANDPKGTDMVIAQVMSDPNAARNLKTDIDKILRSGFKAGTGVEITALRGFVQPDGHFVVIDPGFNKFGPVGKKSANPMRQTTAIVKKLNEIQSVLGQ